MKQTKRKLKTLIDGMEFPDFSKIKLGDPHYKYNLIGAMNYANYVYEDKQLKDFAVEYAKNMNLNVSTVPDYELRPAGIRAWLLKNDADVPEETVDKLYEQLGELAKKYKKEEVDIFQRNDNIKKRTEFIVSEFESIIDSIMGGCEDITPPINIMRNCGSKFDIGFVKNYFTRQLEQTKIKEDYANQRYRKSCEQALSVIVSDILKFTDATKTNKTIRKPRKKTINPAKMVKKLNYAKEYNGIKSVQPEQIIGKSVVWVFNTKTRVLGTYISESGFMAKGSTLYNYDIDKSVGKVLRKPDDVIKELMRCGKIEQRRFLDNIKATTKKLNGRMNKDTIILKVYT